MSKSLDLTFSILTPSLNQASLIPAGLHSVLDQDYPNIEHVIIDCESTDNTIEIISEFQTQYLAKQLRLLFVSEHDSGMYDALNKGIYLSSGEIIGFLNADDSYCPDIFSQVAEVFHSSPELDGLTGTASIVVLDDFGKRHQKELLPAVRNEDLFKFTLSNPPAINAWFFRRSVFDKIGLFNPAYKLSGDKEFLLRFATNNLNYKFTEQLFYAYLQHDSSATFSDLKSKIPYWLEDLQIYESLLQSKIDTRKKRLVLHQCNDTCWKIMVATRKTRIWLFLKIFLKGLVNSNLQWIMFLFSKIIEKVRS